MKGLLLFSASLLLSAGVSAQDDFEVSLPSLETMQGQYQAMLEIVVEPLLEQEKLLYEQYAAAVDRMKTDFESKGQTENAAAAASEAELARTKQQSGETDFPGIAAARGKLGAALVKIESGKVPLMIPIRNQYVARLDELRSALVKAGDSDGASAVTEEMKRLASTRLESPKPVAPAAPKIAMREIRNSPLHRTERITGEITLEPGQYQLESNAHVGDREIKGPDGMGTLVLAGPSELQGEVFINRGSFTASDTRFYEANLLANLGGKWFGTRCLFDGCLLNKGGGWFTKFYSSKWTFEDCVFAETFMKRLQHTPIGIQVKNCTFESVTFPSVIFFEDAGKEAVSPWRQMEACHFIGCVVPQSFLLITQDCLFEECVFVEDEEPIKNLTDLSVTIYAQPIGSNRILGNKWEVMVEPANAIPQRPGASIEYVYDAGELRFR
ncbi:MAG: hypothetical protein AAGH89_10770 [Verrucomicrobiota bacterium]